jgi:hypothetical protein
VLGFEQPRPPCGERPGLGGVADVSSFEQQRQQRFSRRHICNCAVLRCCRLCHVIAPVRREGRHVRAVALDVGGGDEGRHERGDALSLRCAKPAEHAARRGRAQQRSSNGRVVPLQRRGGAVLRHLQRKRANGIKQVHVSLGL